MKKVMVTGASGILGRRLVTLLTHAVDQVVLFSGDITDLEVIRLNLHKHSDVTHFFHLAAVVPTNEVESRFAYALDVNAYGTGLLLASLIEAGMDPWFCYVSSSHVYEPSEAPLTEDSACCPSSLYGLTKYLGEMNLEGLRARYNGVIAIARVFSYYDEAQVGSFLYPAWVEKTRNWDGRSELEVYGGNSVRDFSHASEVVLQLKKLMQSGFSGTVNLGMGRPKKVVDFLKEMVGDQYPFISLGTSNTIVPDTQKLSAICRGSDDQAS